MVVEEPDGFDPCRYAPHRQKSNVGTVAESVALRNGLRPSFATRVESCHLWRLWRVARAAASAGAAEAKVATMVSAEREDEDDDMASRLTELENVQIVPCRGLRVAFFVDGVDVTAPAGYKPQCSPLDDDDDDDDGGGNDTENYGGTATIGGGGGSGGSVCDPRGGAFGSEYILVDFSAPQQQSQGQRYALSRDGGRRALFLDIEVTARKLWCYFVADAVKRGVLGRIRDRGQLERLLDTEPRDMGQRAVPENSRRRHERPPWKASPRGNQPPTAAHISERRRWFWRQRNGARPLLDGGEVAFETSPMVCHHRCFGTAVVRGSRWGSSRSRTRLPLPVSAHGCCRGGSPPPPPPPIAATQ